MTSPSEQAPTADLPQRVTTLELFLALALAAWPLAVGVDAATGIALLTVVVAGALAVERRGKHATVEA